MYYLYGSEIFPILLLWFYLFCVVLSEDNFGSVSSFIKVCYCAQKSFITCKKFIHEALDVYMFAVFYSPFSSFVYETEHFNGVAELLEILGRYVGICSKGGSLSVPNAYINFFLTDKLSFHVCLIICSLFNHTPTEKKTLNWQRHQRPKSIICHRRHQLLPETVA